MARSTPSAVSLHDLPHRLNRERGAFQKKSSVRPSAVAAAFTLLSLIISSSSPAAFTWDGGGGSNQWQIGANWVGDSAPGDFQDLVFAGNVRTTANNGNLGLIINSLTFDASAAAFTLTGNASFLRGGITNASSQLQTITFLNLNLRGAQTITNTNGGSLVIGTAASEFRFDDLSTIVTFEGSGTTRIDARLVQTSGVGSIVKNGSGLLLLNSGSTEIGGSVTVNAGVMRSGTAGAFANNITYTVNGGTLDLNDYALTMGALSGTGGTVDLGTASLTVSQSGSTTFGGAIIGTNGLVKSGSGALALRGSSSYTGETKVTAGTLEVGAGGVINSSNAVTVGGLSGSNATLLLNGGFIDSTVSGIGADASRIRLSSIRVNAILVTY